MEIVALKRFMKAEFWKVPESFGFHGVREIGGIPKRFKGMKKIAHRIENGILEISGN